MASIQTYQAERKMKNIFGDDLKTFIKKRKEKLNNGNRSILYLSNDELIKIMVEKISTQENLNSFFDKSGPIVKLYKSPGTTKKAILPSSFTLLFKNIVA